MRIILNNRDRARSPTHAAIENQSQQRSGLPAFVATENQSQQRSGLGVPAHGLARCGPTL